MNEKELLNLIEKGETHAVEFKESLCLKDETGEEVSAFSNSRGGLLLVGVTDKKKVIGVQIGKRTIEDLANYIKMHTDNHVFPKISVEGIEGKKVIAIEIKKSSEKPVFFKGRAYVRVGNSTHKLSASEMRSLAKESGEAVCWDSEICINAGPEDLDEEKVRWFLRKAKIERNLNIDERTPIREALEKLELLKEGKMTNAAILMFGKNPQRFFLQSEVRCAKFKGTEAAKPFIDMRVLKGTLFDHIDEGERFVLNNIKKAAWIEQGKIERQEKWEYPSGAIREAIINAVCHRDYESSSNVQVRIFDDRLEIWNPGKLPVGWTTETLRKKHESKPYNSLIAQVFFLVGYIEAWGTGTTDIIKEAIKHGLPEPLFESTATSIIITLRKYKISEDLLEELGDRQRMIIRYLLENKTIGTKACSEAINASEDTALRELAKLVGMKILKQNGKGKKTYYDLK